MVHIAEGVADTTLGSAALLRVQELGAPYVELGFDEILDQVLPQTGMRAMGIIPCISYDANIRMSLGLGTTDEAGDIIEDNTRWIVRALARFCELMCRHAGVMDQTAEPMAAE